MESDEVQREYLSETQLASLWGVTASRVAQCRSLGKGPAFIKLPTGEIRYSRSEVEHWLASERRTRTARRRPSAAITSELSPTLGARLISLGQELVALGTRSTR
jgi:hypothetical protein